MKFLFYDAKKYYADQIPRYSYTINLICDQIKNYGGIYYINRLRPKILRNPGGMMRYSGKEGRERL